MQKVVEVDRTSQQQVWDDTARFRTASSLQVPSLGEGASVTTNENTITDTLTKQQAIDIIMRDDFYKKKELVAEVVRAEQQALSGVGSTFNPMADKTTVIGQAPVVATNENTTTTNLTKQQATDIISQDDDGKPAGLTFFEIESKTIHHFKAENQKLKKII